MKIKDILLSGFAVDRNKLSLIVIPTILSIGVISVYALSPVNSGSSGIVVPNATATPTPKKPKQLSVGDVNGDPDNVPNRGKNPARSKSFKPNSPESNGSLKTTNSARSRTESVNNNESLRSTTTGNAAGSQGVVNSSYEMSKSDQIKARRNGTATPRSGTTSGAKSNIASRGSANGKSLRKKNGDIEVENDETHRTVNRAKLRTKKPKGRTRRR